MGVLIKPIVTEKMTSLGEKPSKKQYGFVVSLEAGKDAIRKEVESLYGVNVESIRTLIQPAKRRRRWTKAGLIQGKTSRVKKAYVTLAGQQEIDLFANL